MTTDLGAYRAAKAAGGWSTGEAVCLDCKAEWVAVAPAGEKWLDCPKCSLTRGRFKVFHTWDEDVWTCNCGNELFYVTPKRVYCPNCGTEQMFP